MKNEKSLIIYVFIAWLSGFAGMKLMSMNTGIIPEYKDAKHECEISIPRGQQCVMYFKVEDK